MFQPGLSYWEEVSFFKDINFCIIGSGIVGLNAAISIKEKHPDANVIILEKGMIPSGASTRNAGFACFGSISELLDDLKYMSEDGMLSLVEKRWSGLQRLKSRVGNDLGLKMWGGYELFREEDKIVFENCKEKIEYLNHQLSSIIGNKDIYEQVDSQIKNFGFEGIQHLILNKYEGQIHTGNMMKKLLDIATKKGIQIYNGASVQHIEESKDSIQIKLGDSREIHCQKVLIATNGFAKKFLKDESLFPARNQVLITEPISQLKIKGTFHYDAGYYYFRNVGNRILFGGGRNLSPIKEQTDAFGTTPLIRGKLEKMLREIILPKTDVKIDKWWSGILGVGHQKKPIIKKLSPRMAIAVRMGGMGIAIGSLVGEEGAGLLD